MRKFTCQSCGARIRRDLVAFSWPSRIRCKKCSARHTVSYPATLGISYIAVIAALIVGINVGADVFEIKRGNIYSASLAQTILELGAPLFAFAIGGFLYTWVLGRFFELRRHGP